MISIAIMLILVAGFTPLLQNAFTGYSSHEARNSLELAAETAAGQIGAEVTACKRLFGTNSTGTSTDLTFLNSLTLPASAPLLPGTLLPIVSPANALSPLAPSIVGNCLLVLVMETPVDVTANDSAAVSHSVRIDSYHFSFFYLTTGSGKPVGGQNQIMLQKWRSTSFMDQTEIAAIPDATLQANTGAALFAAGHTMAITPSATTNSGAFFTIGGGGALSAFGGTYPIAQTTGALAGGPMFKILTGITGGGYHYGVSPNNSATFTTIKPVPEFATAAGQFPSGFEVAIVGPNIGRQVLIRLVLAAQGSFPTPVAAENLSIMSTRDVP